MYRKVEFLEKGKVYVPAELRPVLECKKVHIRYWESNKGYLNWLWRNWVDVPDKVNEHFKRKNWERLVILGKIKTTSLAKDTYKYLVIYPPTLHQKVNAYLEGFVSRKCPASIAVVIDAMITFIDKTGKIFIPKSYRDYAGLEPEKHVVIGVKEKFGLEIWNSHKWKTAPKILKGLFDDTNF